MTITRVTDDPGTTPFAVERSTPDAHRWLVWALLVEIPLRTGQDQTSWTPSWDRADHGAWEILLDAQDETRHHERPIGSHGDTAYGTRRHHGRPHEIGWSAARRIRQAGQKHGYRDDDPCEHLSHETGRDAVCTATRPELNYPPCVLTTLCADRSARRAARTGSAASSSG